MHANKSEINRKWWKESIIYQIYPRSFQDSNGDGIGDIQGIIKRLDYLKTLGINVVWLSPCYQSPNDDNGYDISDYTKIMSDFGTMEDWEMMIEEMHKRGIKLVMDLVINHTSDEHEWFQKSQASKENNPYRDYYIWRPPKITPNGDKIPPNNWKSFFSGSVWEYDQNTEEYYLHLFSKKQPDLNWNNPIVRNELMNMIRFWLNKGVDGFRMDAINVISKPLDFPDDNNAEYVSQFFFNGPQFTEFISEIKQKVFDKFDIFTIGEMPNVSPEHGELYTDEMNGICNMLFHFEMMDVDTIPGKVKFDFCDYKLTDIKKIMTQWQIKVIKGWNTLYLENHDQPRSVSRFGNDSNHDYRILSSKMLATWLHMMQGTPFIYQGQEIGMTNVQYETIDEYNDLESKNYYKEALQKGIKTKEELMQSIYKKGRDNARTPMQWDSSANAGFTTGSPWLQVNKNYTEINVENSIKDPNSIFHYYQKLIQLRKDYMIIVYGTFHLLHEEDNKIYVYTRTLDNEQLLVISNWSSETIEFTLESSSVVFIEPKAVNLLISNYEEKETNYKSLLLKPYEVRVYHFLK